MCHKHTHSNARSWKTVSDANYRTAPSKLRSVYAGATEFFRVYTNKKPRMHKTIYRSWQNCIQISVCIQGIHEISGMSKSRLARKCCK
jgi:hypothetical protein